MLKKFLWLKFELSIICEALVCNLFEKSLNKAYLDGEMQYKSYLKYWVYIFVVYQKSTYSRLSILSDLLSKSRKNTWSYSISTF